MSRHAALTTERLRLVPVSYRDVGTLHAHWSLPEVGRWLFDGEVPPRERVEEEVAASLALFDEQGLGIWGVYEPESDLLGASGFLRVPEIDEIEILFSIDPSRWRRGYGLEASRVALRQAFWTPALTRVIGRCDVPNVASRRLLERLGMKLDKREPIHGLDSYHFSLERDAYRADAASRHR